MVKYVLIGTLLLVSVNFKGQESFNKEGVLKASATFAIGTNLKSGATNFYLPGFLEYYLNEQVSVRGDVVLFLGNGSEESVGFLQNHNLFAGLGYHFTKENKFDPYIEIQPGIALSQYGITGDVIFAGNVWLSAHRKTSATINPVFAPAVGFNYYANKYFHLFINARYIYGKHYSEIPVKSLNEFRFDFGLGFNIDVKK